LDFLFPYTEEIDQKSKILVKIIETLVKNRNFGQNQKFWSKSTMLVKIKNFGLYQIFWSKIKKFGQKSKIVIKNQTFWSKIKNFDQKSKFLTNSMIHCDPYLEYSDIFP